MQVSQTIAIRETLTGDWSGGALNIVIEAGDDNALIELTMNAFTARALAMFLTDLVAAPENPMNQAGD